MQEKTDENGKWISEDGNTWLLIETTPLFESKRKPHIPKQPVDLTKILIQKGIISEADL